jgi:putative DNA-invertase from lambdoid prophage Rac
MNAIVYARVSLSDGSQTVENQLRELDAWTAAMAGRDSFLLVERITDEASTRDRRPGKERALGLLRTKLADTVVFWSLDRWGRTSAELLAEFEEASRAGWTLISLKEGFSLDTAAGRLYAGLLGIFAQFERDRLRERTMAGLARARAQGKRLGRPPKRKERAA